MRLGVCNHAGIAHSRRRFTLQLACFYMADYRFYRKVVFSLSLSLSLSPSGMGAMGQ